MTPILILWCIYMILRAVIGHHSQLGGTPTGSGLPFWVAVAAVIGFSMWGNEPDFWRYGKPRFSWPLPTYLFSAFWFTLFIVAGWVVMTGDALGDAAQLQADDVAHHRLAERIIRDHQQPPQQRRRKHF